MSAVYSIRMFSGSVSSGGTVTLATVPPGYVWVVRDVSVTAPTSTDAGSVAIYVSGGTPSATIQRWASVAGLSTVQWQGRQVLEAGDDLRMLVGAGSVQALVSGYQLSAP